MTTKTYYALVNKETSRVYEETISKTADESIGKAHEYCIKYDFNWELYGHLLVRKIEVTTKIIW